MSRRGDDDDEANKGSCSLLVRNLSYKIRGDDLRRAFERFGDIRDVYIPRDYYSQRARGFAFVEFRDSRDAADAKESMDRYEIDGREIGVVFAQERRKTPDEMRTRSRRSESRSRRRSYSRSRSRDRRDRSYSREYRRDRREDRDRDRDRSRDRDRDRDRSPSREKERRRPRSDDDDDRRPKSRDDDDRRDDGVRAKAESSRDRAGADSKHDLE